MSGSAKTAVEALVAAQAAMGKAVKDTVNPAFKSRYADLSSVWEACAPALNANGFAIMQPTGHDEHGEFIETVFLHVSGERFATRVYLRVGKNDMQAYGSAMTYARRYGLMNLAGIAPEDDDGNAAAKSQAANGPAASGITADQYRELRTLMDVAQADEAAFAAFMGVKHVEEMPAAKFGAAVAALRQKIAKAAATEAPDA